MWPGFNQGEEVVESVAKLIQDQLSRGYSVSIYPPGTSSKGGCRVRFLAVTAGPFVVGRHEPATVFTSKSAEGDTPDEAVRSLLSP
jgi:hypothetical protein